jgi:hypothetical protein
VNKTIFNSNTRDGLPRAAAKERAVSYPDVALWVGAARPSGGKTAVRRLRARLRTLMPRGGLNEGFVYLVTFSEVTKFGILITIHIQLFSKSYL